MGVFDNQSGNSQGIRIDASGVDPVSHSTSKQLCRPDFMVYGLHCNISLTLWVMFADFPCVMAV